MDLFSEDFVLMFHSRSKDVPPGAGVGEKLGLANVDLSALGAIPDWRRLLSNFAPAEFSLNGLRWATVEHCFQATKFDTIAPDYFHSFSLDSGSDLSRAEGAVAKSAGGRRGRPMTPEQIADWESRKWGVMKLALEAKYRANPLHRSVLLATWPAKLTHRPLRSSYTQVEHGLMEVRAQLREESGLSSTWGAPTPS